MSHASITLRSLALALALAAGAAAASCSGDSKKEVSGTGGTGGTMAMAEPIECGTNTCQPVNLVKGIDPLLPCCVDDGCGLDSSFIAQYGVMFNEACQAKNQPGVPGHGCFPSPMLTVPGSTFAIPPLAGCCRTDTKTCGYQLDKLLGLFDVGLGCIDSSPFLDGGAPPDCDPEGAAGAGP